MAQAQQSPLVNVVMKTSRLVIVQQGVEELTANNTMLVGYIIIHTSTVFSTGWERRERLEKDLSM